jgi:hypothetical protein
MRVDRVGVTQSDALPPSQPSSVTSSPTAACKPVFLDFTYSNDTLVYIAASRTAVCTPQCGPPPDALM